jgi:membrane fusion protein (multidrug efflux system)
VAVDDNQRVRTGEVLVTLDARDFEARLAQAQANLRAARARYQAATLHVQVIGTTTAAGVQQAEAGVDAAGRQIEGARSRLAQARAQVAAAVAEATRAESEAARYERLLQVHAVSQQERDAALAARRATAAQLEAAERAAQATEDRLRHAEAQLGQAQGQLAGAQAAPAEVAYSRAQAEQAAAEIAQLEAAARQAELDLSYTRIVAPEAGRITKKAVEPGDFVQSGRALLVIVPEQVWVIANFKETQLDQMHPGQPVAVTVDAYPGVHFRGHVDSIQAGSGAAFSLLPPENATGNYVKVVQRVPVKILLDDPPDPTHPVGPGMSVVPTVTLH